ncbi:hypothetical protein GCM10007888_37610 [Methylobacterium oxalidis]|uniref:Helix-hairpin-helix domain-containing protein n=1 Tax=Methylobacterium oxalidis TaxID=944322 RepID=A0ABQ6DMM6_9HYPH|nr:helix-hairpin-helix domain-containing protein [Methylobacterium oxalidis]GLS65379.1 hypothetical protein GCM10007888_37610 [Methylobacterium oxalidis]
MRRSTLFISAALVTVSAIGAGLWVSHSSRSRLDQDKPPVSVAHLSTQQRSVTDPDGDPVRTVYPGPLGGSVEHLSRPAQNEGADAPASAAATPAAVTAEPATAERAASELPPAQGPDAGASADNVGVDVASASTAAEPAASGTSIDLNTASVEELNALGAGMIGRRIIAFRPYASPEDLVNRRVLKRSDFEVIKTAITVR